VKPLRLLFWMALASAAFAACGPDPKPGPPCEGPTYDLKVMTENRAALPPDTRLNVRYGGNHEGEAYALGENPTPQAVFCDEDTTPGGASGVAGAAGDAAGAGGAASVSPSEGVFSLRCRLYTQGPARVDVTATGYEPIEELDLMLDEKLRCRVQRTVELKVLIDAGI
jgi:hypothetical protein